MKILVTGGAGYIASHTNVALLNAGYEVVAVDNFSNSSIDAVKSVEKITGKEITFYEGDVCDKEILEKIFSENEIYAVINFEGLKAVGESCAKPLLYYRNNLVSTLSLVEVMAKYGCKKLVFSSSATVYGVPKSVPIREDFPLSTTNPYGETKLMIERMLKDACAADPDLSCCVLRYFNPIGAHESGLIGEDPKGIPNNLLPYITKVAIGKLECLSVFGNDYPTHDGTGVRDYIHVVDLAEAHLKALDYTKKLKGIDFINVGTGNGYSVLDIISAFSNAWGSPINYQIADRRPGDVAECYADPTKAHSVLGWRAVRDLAKMCEDSARWQRQNPEGYEK